MKRPKPKGGTHAQRVRGGRTGDAKEPPGTQAPSVADGDDPFGEDFLTPDEMRQWAQREMREAARALDLRARELFDLVDAYSSGKITPEKADELHYRYQHRWGEALPGVVQGDIGDPPLTDEHILSKVDKSNTPFITPREAYERSRTGRTPSGGGTSR
jgi:hypothetical protein